MIGKTMIGKTMIGKTMIGKTEEEDRLVASPFLFRFAIPCLRHDSGWSKKGIQLSEKFTLPCFGLLDKTNPKSVQAWAEIRAAWNPAGIILNARVTGKRQPPWCRASRIEESDGIAVWINTRNTSQIHRASRFCHEFCFLPSGAGTKLNEPVAKQLAIQRAKENVAIHESSPPLIRSERRVDGYLLEAFIPADHADRLQSGRTQSDWFPLCGERSGNGAARDNSWPAFSLRFRPQFVEYVGTDRPVATGTAATGTAASGTAASGTAKINARGVFGCVLSNPRRRNAFLAPINFLRVPG